MNPVIQGALRDSTRGWQHQPVGMHGLPWQYDFSRWLQNTPLVRELFGGIGSIGEKAVTEQPVAPADIGGAALDLPNLKPLAAPVAAVSALLGATKVLHKANKGIELGSLAKAKPKQRGIVKKLDFKDHPDNIYDLKPEELWDKHRIYVDPYEEEFLKQVGNPQISIPLWQKIKKLQNEGRLGDSFKVPDFLHDAINYRDEDIFKIRPANVKFEYARKPGGSYAPSSDLITVRVNRDATPAKIRQTLAHELQHNVQTKQGMKSQGASVKGIKSLFGPGVDPYPHYQVRSGPAENWPYYNMYSANPGEQMANSEGFRELGGGWDLMPPYAITHDLLERKNINKVLQNRPDAMQYRLIDRPDTPYLDFALKRKSELLDKMDLLDPKNEYALDLISKYYGMTWK